MPENRTQDTDSQVERPRRHWTTQATLRTRAARVDNAQRQLNEAIVDAYREGMSTRAIGRDIGRSHRWVIKLLTTEGAYDVALAVALAAQAGLA